MNQDPRRGRRIDTLIHQSGKSPKQLAALWSCSEARISAIRNGENFSLPLLIKICSTMEWSADYIVFDKSPDLGGFEMTPADRYDLHLLHGVNPAQRDALRGLLASMAS